MRTRDGLKLGRVLRALEQLGAQIRRGSNHPFIAFRENSNVPCPIATSTDAKRMIVPWIKQMFGYENSQEIYESLRRGRWQTYELGGIR